jgi:ribosomal protein L15
LGKGRADDKVRIEGVRTSKKAKEKIEKAGGSVKL